jgi:hypothetical protein
MLTVGQRGLLHPIPDLLGEKDQTPRELTDPHFDTMKLRFSVSRLRISFRLLKLS